MSVAGKTSNEISKIIVNTLQFSIKICKNVMYFVYFKKDMFNTMNFHKTKFYKPRYFVEICV